MSMMLRRAAASAAGPFTTTSESSGPRWRRVRIMLVATHASASDPDVTKPAMPHMSGHSRLALAHFKPVRQRDQPFGVVLDRGARGTICRDDEPRPGLDDVVRSELMSVADGKTQNVLTRPQRQRFENAIDRAA